MKKKLLALVCALALAAGLVGCTLSTPDTVGKIGDYEVNSGTYLLAQYSAYQQACQLAGTDQDTSDVKAFLKATITTDADTGETALVRDFVADKTRETLEFYAAVESRFDALGGKLTEEQLASADSAAQQLMDQYGDTYTANGIGLDTLKSFQRTQLKHTALLEMVYGAEGETPVSDSQLTEHLVNDMYEIAYVSIPLYNTSTYAFADEDQSAQMLKLAQSAAQRCNAAIGDAQDVSVQVSALYDAAAASLPEIYAVLDNEYTADSASVQTELLTGSTLDAAFTQGDSADAVRSLACGEAAATQYNSVAMMLLMRIDPLAVSSLDDLRSQILSDLKGDELDESLTQYGAQLTDSLSDSAMKKLPAAKIVNS